MPDPAPFDAVQEQVARRILRNASAQAVRQLLSVLDPQPGDGTLGYQALLQRAQTVIATLLAQEGSEGGGAIHGSP